VTIEAAGPYSVVIRGGGWGGLMSPAGPLDAANSGTTLRLMAGLLAGRPLSITISGDASLRRRPMGRVIEPLAAMGATIASEHGKAPLSITGGSLTGIEWRPPVASAQIKSALMLAGLSAHGDTVVHELQATRDHSELAFPAFGLRVSTNGLSVTVPGQQDASAPAAGVLEVPGDASSAAAWAAAAAALPGSAVSLMGVGLNPRRLGFVSALRSLGADIRIEATHTAGGESVGRIHVAHGHHGHATLGASDVPDLIDELPVLAARAALGGSLAVSGASELRVKESDRIAQLVAGFRNLGVDADERPDGFVISGQRRPTGGHVDAAHDHRLVMAFTIVGLGATGPTLISGADAVAVSYPAFVEDLGRLIS
jgi:3-phosphoshikimate 1-carboxyvinyltransferase